MTVTPEILRAAVPVLLRVAVCAAPAVPTGWFPKERLPGETPPVGAVAATPVPLRFTLLRAPQLPVEMLSVAERSPVVLGVKVKLTEQFAPGASELPQLLDCPNLLAYVPPIATPVMYKDAPPVFVRVTLCAALVVLMATVPNETLVTETPATPCLGAAEKPLLLEAQRTASPMMTAGRIPAFRGI